MKPKVVVDYFPDEPERVAVVVSGITVDIFANLDGTINVEFYGDGEDMMPIVQHASINRYTTRHPSLTLELVKMTRIKELRDE